MAVTPDGTRVVSGSADGTIRIWDTKAGVELAVLKASRIGRQGSISVESIVLTSNGSQIVAGLDDKTARLLDVETGNELVVLKGHSSHVKSVAVTRTDPA